MKVYSFEELQKLKKSELIELFRDLQMKILKYIEELP